MFEVPALRWADISDASHGLSILNDSKYGYDGKDNVLRISLLRSPDSPDPHADEGHHHFIYSLYPHAGDWKQAETVRRGYELNYQLMAESVESHTGETGKPFSQLGNSFGPRQSFISISARNVVLTSVKKAEDEKALVFRFYEWAGLETDVTIDLPTIPEKVYLTNLMEENDRELIPKGHQITIHTKPYEIQTVKVTFPVKMVILD